MSIIGGITFPHLPRDQVLELLDFLQVLWVFLHVLVIEEGLEKRRMVPGVGEGEVDRADIWLKRGNMDAHYLLVVGETSHHSWVHDPVQQHGQGVDGKVGVVEVPLHHAADLLIGQLHRLQGVLQRADLLLCSPQSGVVIRWFLFTRPSPHWGPCITIGSLTSAIKRHFVSSDRGRVRRRLGESQRHINHLPPPLRKPAAVK